MSPSNDGHRAVARYIDRPPSAPARIAPVIINSIMRVSALGDSALTVTPKRASSFAAVLVKPMIPAFAAA